MVLPSALVIENESKFIKAGFSGDNFPKIIQSIRSSDTKSLNSQTDGRGVLTSTFNSPIDGRGIVTNWEAMSELWTHIFNNKLHIDPHDQPILLTEPPQNTKLNREKLTEIMFETFEFPALYISNSAVLSLHESGRTTGVVVNSGHTATFSVPIYQSFANEDATFCSDIGGAHVSEMLRQLLAERGIKSTAVEDAKQKLCYVALNFQQELNISTENVQRVHKLLDGQFLSMESERFRSPEILFQPLLAKSSQPSITTILHKSIMTSELKTQKELYDNIVLSGDTARMPGFVERLQYEMEKLVPTGTRVRVTDSKENSAWVGGSILAATAGMQHLWFTRKEYDDAGAKAVHIKCF